MKKETNNLSSQSESKIIKEKFSRTKILFITVVSIILIFGAYAVSGIVKKIIDKPSTIYLLEKYIDACHSDDAYSMVNCTIYRFSSQIEYKNCLSRANDSLATLNRYGNFTMAIADYQEKRSGMVEESYGEDIAQKIGAFQNSTGTEIMDFSILPYEIAFKTEEGGFNITNTSVCYEINFLWYFQDIQDYG
jgi:hypothetical protein